jgi:hypothetical protein
LDFEKGHQKWPFFCPQQCRFQNFALLTKQFFAKQRVQKKTGRPKYLNRASISELFIPLAQLFLR